MLPEILSNDRCSLHPGSPKAVLSILMRIEKTGQVKESFVTESIIESIHRGVYDEINEQLIIHSGKSKIENDESFDTFGVKSTTSHL